jgi:O-6-methylguanine DNA methyltransferase
VFDFDRHHIHVFAQPLKTTMKDETIALSVTTPDGEFISRYSNHGLASLSFPSKAARGDNSSRGKAAPQILRWHRATTTAIQQALAGRAPKSLPPLDLSSGTGFQRAVWAAMRNLRAGQTCSYGELAKQIGKPNAARAVGGACGANPIPVLVPCHRVLAANRKLGGFSGGLDWKRKLLAREAAMAFG